MNNGFNIVSLFLEQAALHPDRMAIADKHGSVSFGNLAAQVKRNAREFKHRGLKAGDRVLVFVPMSRELYAKVLALFYIGATAVFLDEWVNIKRLNLCCSIAQCRGFIAPFKLRALAFLLSKEVRSIPLWFNEKCTPSTSEESVQVIDESCATALITFTTGSTGTPKAAKRTHAFLHAQFEALMEKIQPEEGDVDMPVLPIVLMINLGCGVPSVIADWQSSKPEKMDPSQIQRQIETYGVNRITSSPYFLLRLSQHAIETGWETSRFRKFFTGGAPVFPSEARIYLQAFPKSNIQIVFGSTEAEPISSIHAADLVAAENISLEKGLPVGSIHHTAEVRIITWRDEVLRWTEHELQSNSLAAGEIGEIIVSGNHVLREYFNNPEALQRNKIFIGETCWHRTGDSGFIGEDGLLFLTGRCKYLFSLNGRIVSPFLFENRIKQIPGVAMGTILQKGGHTKTVVELAKDAKITAVAEALKASGMVPDELQIITKMPRDKRHFSKIDYDQLLSD